MRPKRRILIVDANEQRAAIWRMVLFTNGYAVRSAATAPEALKAAWDFSAEAVLLILPLPEAQSLIRQLRRTMPLARVLAYAEGMREMPGDIEADSYELGRPPVATVMDRLRALTRRKRGPRKGFKLDDLVRKAPAAETVTPAVPAESRVA